MSKTELVIEEALPGFYEMVPTEELQKSKCYVYQITAQFRDFVAGGRPKTKNMLVNFLKTKGMKAEEIAEIAEEDENVIDKEDLEALKGPLTAEEEADLQTTGFKMVEGSLVIEGRYLKACFKEEADKNRLNTLFKNEGFKHWQQTGLMVKPDIIKLYTSECDERFARRIFAAAPTVPQLAETLASLFGTNLVTEPTQKDEHPVTVYQPSTKTKQSCIKRLEVLHRPIFRCEIWAEEHKAISDKLIRLLLAGMQDIGLGAARPLGYGKFDILECRLVNVPSLDSMVRREAERLKNARKTDAEKYNGEVDPAENTDQSKAGGTGKEKSARKKTGVKKS